MSSPGARGRSRATKSAPPVSCTTAAAAPPPSSLIASPRSRAAVMRRPPRRTPIGFTSTPDNTAATTRTAAIPNAGRENHRRAGRLAAAGAVGVSSLTKAMTLSANPSGSGFGSAARARLALAAEYSSASRMHSSHDNRCARISSSSSRGTAPRTYGAISAFNSSCRSSVISSTLCGARHKFSEPDQSIAQARLRRPLGNPEFCCHLPICPPAKICEHDCLALHRRQLAQSRNHRVSVLDFCRCARVGTFAHGRLDLRQKGFLRSAQRFLPPYNVHGLVARNACKKGVEAPPRWIESSRPPPQCNKGVLRDLLGEGRFTEDTAGDPEHQSPVGVDCRPERVFVARHEHVYEERVGPPIHGAIIVVVRRPGIPINRTGQTPSVNSRPSLFASWVVTWESSGRLRAYWSPPGIRKSPPARIGRYVG